jgi:hypothetical protein
MIQNLNEHWKSIKSNEIKTLLLPAQDFTSKLLYAEVSPGSILHLKLETTNRSTVPIKQGVTTLPDQKTTFLKFLQNNTAENTNLDIQLPENIAYTHPYWLKTRNGRNVYRQQPTKHRHSRYYGKLKCFLQSILTALIPLSVPLFINTMTM